MRLFVAALLGLSALPCHAAAPVLHNPPDLRHTLQQYPHGAPQAPRRLSTEQRAELRRQLHEFHPRRRNP